MPHLSFVLWLSVAASPNFASAPGPSIGREQAGVVQPDSDHTWLLGGQSVDGGVATLLSSTEILDADAGVWSAGVSLSAAREGLTALELPGGDVLACGGKVGTTLAKYCDRYFVGDGGFWPTSAVPGVALPAHPGLGLLSDGTVLVAGGALYIYAPSTDSFAQPGDLPNYGGKVIATGLDGTVWVADTTVSGDLLDVSATGTVNDLGTLPFTPAEMGTLGTGEIVLVAASGATAIVTPPGDGLMTVAPVPGGNGSGVLTAAWSGGLVLVTTTDVYLLATDHSWTLLGTLADPRSNGATSSLPDGRVLYIGGRTFTAPIQSVSDTDVIGSNAGSTCSVAGQCLSGFCANGNCCSTDCSGSCQTCATGACATVAVGAPGQCGGEGACAGACEEDAGCYFPPECVDAGPPDAGPPDAGPVDAGPPDAGLPCFLDGGCPFEDVACSASCQSGICIYPTALCAPCSACDLGACDAIPAGTDPFNSCIGTDGCGGACAGDGGCAFPTNACTTGNICLNGQSCANGACGGGTSVANCCIAPSDCAGPLDGGGGGVCGATCVENQCTYSTGTCGDCHRCETGLCAEDDTLACSDNNACTTTDHCTAGVCASNTPTLGCCNSAADCPQAADICQQAACTTNACGFAPVAGCCHASSDCVATDPTTLAVCLSNQCQFYFDVPDAGPVDAGPEDAGPADAGHVGRDGGHAPHDAGFDAGPEDAGPTDAGSELADAGDGGRADAGHVTSTGGGGCGCSPPLDAAGWAWWAPGIIGVAARRRRRAVGLK